MTLDHLAYCRDRPYRREVNARLRRLLARRSSALRRLTVVHEDGYGCCRVEPWLTTCARLVDALNADGTRTLGVLTR